MTYLKDSDEIFDNIPVIVIKFILPQLQHFVSGDLINGALICPVMLYGQETTTPTLYKHWILNDLKSAKSWYICSYGQCTM